MFVEHHHVYKHIYDTCSHVLRKPAVVLSKGELHRHYPTKGMKAEDTHLVYYQNKFNTLGRAVVAYFRGSK